MNVHVKTRGRLGDDEVTAVLSLVEAATESDGVRPLNEHVMLHLRYGGEERAKAVLVYDGPTLVGFAHLDPTDPVEGPSGELVIAPAHRRRGHGHRLLSSLLDLAGGRLRLWAHGDHPGAARLAAAHGLTRARSLWQMRRSLFAPLDTPAIPPGVRVRTFVPGQDEDEWIALNARAFASHPEQGAWLRPDLERREQESWFDPAGFFLAEREGKLVGFHWTKTHGDGEHAHDPIGEVYVVGVDPAEQGTGLGRALTLAGLAHLRSRGLGNVLLYVDEENAAAVRLYESLGFARWDTDVMYTRG
ncbi:mycothiol synthase [Sinosporangium siamense]|uniref:Mycothiol acetyltransferase n=1 Tax=Sinosporangium siamense TaxID=1367973 RepID=A0A919RK53_9ACTN|nr:mycothiol synthase [Sinosporangium siamense]GII93399.1 mycothiol acetyltransferase [Sinosporangium siamense]